MTRRLPLVILALALAQTACLDAGQPSGTPVGIIMMNARTKGAGYTTSPVANFYQASSITFASAAGAGDSCRTAAFSPGGGSTSAAAINAGSTVALSVSGRADTLRKVSTTDLTYRSALTSGLAFTPGDSVRFTIAGDIAGFLAASFAMKTAEPFTASSLAVPASGAALPVTWTPVGDGASAMIVSLRYNDGTGTTLNAQIFCEFLDDGAGTIPAALVAKWAASAQRDTYMQRLRTLIWQSTSSGQFANVISTFELPTPVSP